MSTAAAVRPRITQGWEKVSRSIIENMGTLSHAELMFTLIILRRTEAGEPVSVSDQTWKDWTRREPRMKRAAIQGLKSKGLVVKGEGDKARYSWAEQSWHAFLRTVQPSERARTAGKPVDPKPSQKIHPECRERGCQRLCGDEDAKCEVKPPSPLVVMPVRQYIANSTNPVDNSTPPQSTSPASDSTPPKTAPRQTSPTDATPVRQYIAKERPADRSILPLTKAFEAAGVKLNSQDFSRANNEWSKIDTNEERDRAIAYAQQKAKSTEARYMGLPENFLRKREWTRAGDRTLPPPKKITTRDENFVRAAKRFIDEVDG